MSIDTSENNYENRTVKSSSLSGLLLSPNHLQKNSNSLSLNLIHIPLIIIFKSKFQSLSLSEIKRSLLKNQHVYLWVIEGYFLDYWCFALSTYLNYPLGQRLTSMRFIMGSGVYYWDTGAQHFPLI
ncbi:uncharacterized protein J8A68_002783 [[Candida] subhashii]|uniref:Uncharacterized protein n=1 Tax=[Candida] subhashii TaxID=561895 RepID=A0A8J5QR07_9ASCO|nr:uncharacterized protein J8A68_002783 [[Candida] subhashii]KAG7663697.1 hypothetical protein J8A68_002783 [[Candida] subhashii]